MFTIALISKIPCFLTSSSPRNMFSYTQRSETRLNSWGIRLIPILFASAGLLIFISLSSNQILPDVGWYSPERTLMKVDFPAPFSPIMPKTSPVQISTEISLRTRTEENSLVMPSVLIIVCIIFSSLHRRQSTKVQSLPLAQNQELPLHHIRDPYQNLPTPPRAALDSQQH